MNNPSDNFDPLAADSFEEVRRRLQERRGRDLWRGLEEAARSPEFRQSLEREFPEAAGEWDDEPSRRHFLKVMGASLALAGLYGCYRKPTRVIVPYVDQPEQVVPGKPLYFATTVPLGGYGYGALVESHEGRPTKVEGNPQHPASLGASNVFMQSSVLMLYDPDRSAVVTERGNVSDWGTLLTALGPVMQAQQNRGGAGVRILSETVTSPSLADAIRQVLQTFPEARWHQYDPVGRDHVYAGTRLAFGRALNPIYRFDRAKVVLSLDADFLFSDPGSIHYARRFIDGRRVRVGQTEMNRLYAVEPAMSITGSMADHRLPLRHAEVEVFARELARELGVGSAGSWARRCRRGCGRGWRRWRRTSRRIAERDWSWPGCGNRRPCMPWRMRSISRWTISRRSC